MTGNSPDPRQTVTSFTRRGRPGRSRSALTIAAAVGAMTMAALPACSAGATPATARGALTARVAAQGPPVPPPPHGWKTVFSDDFTGQAGAKADRRWKYDTGPGSSFGTGEIETMTNSRRNVHLDGKGNLDITALGSGTSWTSGRIQTTTPNVGAPAGGKLKVLALIRQPAGGLGYWPAFWMLGPGQWPENGEIDIMEDVNSLSEVSGTIHCGTFPGGPCHEGNGIGSGLRPCTRCQSGYHRYAMILSRRKASDQSITFYLDGKEYFQVTEAQVGTSTWRAAFDHKLSIIFDLAMGGGYPNGQCGCTTPTSATKSGGTMRVAYVVAYTTNR
jgi:beta-glucanase (GH16 family)